MEPTVRSEQRDHVLTLTLNRPAKLNCINWAMLKELDEATRGAALDRELRFLVLRGAGERAFSTGGDLGEFTSLSLDETAQWIRIGQQIFNRIESFPGLTLAAVNGFAYGGGLELALACDLRVATPSAAFACPEIQHGWPPGWGGLSRLRRVVGEAKAKEMIFLGEPVEASRALEIGLVNWIVERKQLSRFLAGIADKLCRIDPHLLAFTKSVLSDRARQVGGAALEVDLLASLYARQMKPEE